MHKAKRIVISNHQSSSTNTQNIIKNKIAMRRGEKTLLIQRESYVKNDSCKTRLWENKKLGAEYTRDDSKIKGKVAFVA